MTKYRDNALSVADIKLLDWIHNYYWAEDALVLCSWDFLDLDSDDYHNWIEDWRDQYGRLTRVIKTLKEEGSYSELASARRLANTLLNARQYAKDVRRAAREKVEVTKSPEVIPAEMQEKYFSDIMEFMNFFIGAGLDPNEAQKIVNEELSETNKTFGTNYPYVHILVVKQ